MGLHFFDTSALVKRYYEEPGTEVVDGLIESDDSTVISSLSIIETVSAFRRKYNRNEIAKDEMESLLSAFFSEALDDFVIVPIEESMLQFSFDLVVEDDLRTLDSLQLAAALSVDTDDESPVFVCADSELTAVAEDRGLETTNPRADATE
ncbi:type II toxin-antitoxin system VapC family toxin [Halorientalis pallida]|uniref:type II toxin-antitoxin system VapC family toxin n=1 Tax=Halorientalis pallida TaxID=2479928 RepID=UPI003C6ED0EA